VRKTRKWLPPYNKKRKKPRWVWKNRGEGLKMTHVKGELGGRPKLYRGAERW